MSKIDHSVAGLIKLVHLKKHKLTEIHSSKTFNLVRYEVFPEQGGDSLKEELKETLLKEYDEQLTTKAQKEAKINTKALAALKGHERQLSKPSPVQYYSSKLHVGQF